MKKSTLWKKYLFIAALAAGLLAGVIAYGWTFLVWTIGAVAGVVLGWSLLVRYRPQTLGRLMTALFKLRAKFKDPGPRGANARSDDWPAWFATQGRTGWQPSKVSLTSRWGKNIDPQAVLPEYPRPQLARSRWLNLNGLWSCNVVAREEENVSDFPGQILVPFAIESALSGIQRPLLPGERLWYRRPFKLPADWQADERVVLHFGAVDWQATVYVNGQQQGRHEGGYTPFSFDITDALQRDGDNELVVAVWDPTDGDNGGQQRGKQTLDPQMINYTASSGIWQTVWLEPVPERRLDSVFATAADTTHGTAELTVATTGNCSGLRIKVSLDDEPTLIEVAATASAVLSITPQQKKLWTPDTPHLYPITVQLLDGDEVIDEINSYFALREVGTAKVNGNTVFTLNGQPIFHHGPLDQGYWPESIYTAAADEALVYDIEIMKASGFNMLRKHIKIEPARWYYHADRLGMLVWQDMINGGNTIPAKDLWIDYLQHHAPLGIKHQQVRDNDYQGWGRDEQSRAAFNQELTEMIDTLRPFPSVVMWIPFNEYWGQFDAAQTADWVKQYDPTRLVNHASGFYDQGAGDVYDMHIYMQSFDRVIDPLGTRAPVLGEYGAMVCAVENHKWSDKIFGFGAPHTLAEFKQAYFDLMRKQIVVAIGNGLTGAVYSVLSDVEIETDGLLTYDREVLKIEAEELHSLHNELYQAFAKRHNLKAN